MKISTKQLVQTALLLALCIASQFLKNMSVYITGPIVNAILVIALLTVGLWSAIAISVIAPVTSFIITGSPIMAAIPLLMPVIMISNIILVVAIWLLMKKWGSKLAEYVGMGIGCVVKAAFLWIMTSFVLFPVFGGALPEKAIAVAKVTFSTTQLITAVLGCILAVLIRIPLKKYLNSES